MEFSSMLPTHQSIDNVDVVAEHRNSPQDAQAPILNPTPYVIPTSLEWYPRFEDKKKEILEKS